MYEGVPAVVEHAVLYDLGEAQQHHGVEHEHEYDELYEKVVLQLHVVHERRVREHSSRMRVA